jgi:hypothetical protein
MELAYQFLLKAGCNGVLKLDDNTMIRNPECIELLDDIIRTVDYFGISISKLIKGNYPLEDLRFKLQHMKCLSWELEHDLSFFIGPFYWISRRAIEYVCQHHMRIPLEDGSVGLALHARADLNVLFLPWFERGFVVWGDDSEKVEGADSDTYKKEV